MNDLEGTLFPNKNKKTEKHPDYTGTVIIDNIKYSLSGWSNKSKAGNKYMSLKFRLFEEKNEKPKEEIEEEVF